ILNDVLDYSKIETGLLVLESIDFDLQEQLERVIDLQSANARKKGLELVLDFDPATPTRVRGDPVRFQQIVLNLLGNAIKFTEHGDVVVRAQMVERTEQNIQIRFEVQDSGIGIAPEVRPILFQRFVQADSSTTRRFGGTGLGLAISRRLVEMMHGEIGVISAPEQGSIFWFVAEFGQAGQAPFASEPAGSIEGRRVLVVDDNATNRKVLFHTLKRWKARCECVDGAEAALSELRRAVDEKQQPYELVLLDHHMPMMNGVDLARDILATPSLGRPVMVMLSSHIERMTAAQMKEVGLSACELKPISASRLQTMILRVLGSSAQRPKILKSAEDSSARKALIGKTRILVAEDNPVNQMVALQYLKNAGYTADVVPNGRIAIEAVRKQGYELVFMDVQMPEMDGLEATRQIRKAQADHEPGFPAELYIVAMTANAMSGDKEICIDAGMDGYIAKPLTPADVKGVLEKYLKPLSGTDS
ncbi:MAG: response regulator, partial [Opitutaceae bacterium]